MVIGGPITHRRRSLCGRTPRLSKLSKEQLTIFRRRKVGFVFQSYVLRLIKTFMKNVVLPIELDGACTHRSRFVDGILELLKLLSEKGRSSRAPFRGQQ